MEKEIQNRVIQLTKQHSDKMTEDTGVVSSLEEEDMKSYLHGFILHSLIMRGLATKLKI
jgi:hypothetical protein